MYTLAAIICSTVASVPLQPGDYRITKQIDGVRREFRMHLPPSYDGCTPLPVIVAFHGMSANARLLQRLTELDETADAHGYITVYPEGTGIGPLKGFKSGASTSRFEDRKPDDVLFVHAILDHLEQHVCVDRRRIYATGLSNGAMLCYRLAVEMPHRIAAIAPVSGGLGTQVGLPCCPISVLHFHGTCDKVLPFHGPREKGFFQQSYFSVPHTIQMFVDVAGCDTLSQQVAVNAIADDGTSVCIHTHIASAVGTEVVLVKIVGGGHQWPAHAIPLGYLGRATQEIDANHMMCCFFARHVLGE